MVNKISILVQRNKKKREVKKIFKRPSYIYHESQSTQLIEGYSHKKTTKRHIFINQTEEAKKRIEKKTLYKLKKMEYSVAE